MEGFKLSGGDLQQDPQGWFEDQYACGLAGRGVTAGRPTRVMLRLLGRFWQVVEGRHRGLPLLLQQRWHGQPMAATGLVQAFVYQAELK